MPAVSVVVPLFNKEPYIQRCLESICRQTMPNFEVVVVDDGSSDRSADMAEAIEDPRIRVIRQENRGVSGARNRGIEESRGELIAFLDSDDEWRPSFLETILELRRAYPEAGILATGYRRCRGRKFDEETTLSDPPHGHRRLVRNYLTLASRANPVCSSNTAIARSVLAEVGGFPEGESIGEDRDLWVRIALRYPVAYDVRILSIYHSEATESTPGRRPSASVLPPVVRTLRRAIEEKRIPAEKIPEVKLYKDRVQMQNFYGQLHLRNHAHVTALLREPYFTRRHSALALTWRALLSFLPMRLVEAIRLKPLNAVSRMRGLFSRDIWECRYADLLLRYVPSEARSTGLNSGGADLQPRESL